MGHEYVIVGGGTAGCLLAARLSAAGRRVLLLEAGNDERRAEVLVPGDWPIVTQSDLAAVQLTEPVAALMGRRLPYLYGRLLGGTSAINNLFFERPTAGDFNAWAEAAGEAWSNVSFDRAFTAIEDPISGIVTERVKVAPFTEAFFEAVRELPRGRVRLSDAAPARVNVKGAQRQTAADVFLRPLLSRPELKVICGAQVTRVILERGVAVGVEYRHQGALVRVEAERDVILAAGALVSPKLLMLSGIGSSETLSAVGIPVVVDRKEVGENLHDHVTVPHIYAATHQEQLDPGSPLAEARLFGQLASSSMDSRPDFWIGFSPVAIVFDRSAPPPAGFGLLSALLQPTSRGRLSVRSPDVDAPIVLEPNLLSTREEVDHLVDVVMLAREIGGSSALRKARVVEIAPGPACSTRSQIEQFVRQSVLSFQHPVGTCRMGMDEASVVDPNLRVRGVERLRVVDASVMPSIVAAPIMATTLALAELAAARFLAD